MHIGWWHQEYFQLTAWPSPSSFLMGLLKLKLHWQKPRQYRTLNWNGPACDGETEAWVIRRQ